MYQKLVILIALIAVMVSLGCTRAADEPRTGPTPIPTVYIALPTPTPFFTLTTVVEPSHCAEVSGAGDYLPGTAVDTEFSNIQPSCTYSGRELDITGWVKEESETPYGIGCVLLEPECHFIMNSNVTASYFFDYVEELKPEPTEELKPEPIRVPTPTTEAPAIVISSPYGYGTFTPGDRARVQAWGFACPERLIAGVTVGDIHVFSGTVSTRCGVHLDVYRTGFLLSVIVPDLSPGVYTVAVNAGTDYAEVDLKIDAPRPTPTPKPTATPKPTPTPVPPPTEAEVIEYFYGISMPARGWTGDSYGLVRWRTNPRISVYGSPSDQDLEVLTEVVDELNDLVDGITLLFQDRGGNIQVHFEPERPDKNTPWGVSWDEDGRIEVAYSWIDSSASLERRIHMIRQELAGSIGLWGRSDVYPDSIFNSGWTDTTEYTAIDKEIIKLQYDPRLQAGWNSIQVRRVLEP